MTDECYARSAAAPSPATTSGTSSLATSRLSSSSTWTDTSGTAPGPHSTYSKLCAHLGCTGSSSCYAASSSGPSTRLLSRSQLLILNQPDLKPNIQLCHYCAVLRCTGGEPARVGSAVRHHGGTGAVLLWILLSLCCAGGADPGGSPAVPAPAGGVRRHLPHFSPPQVARPAARQLEWPDQGNNISTYK